MGSSWTKDRTHVVCTGGQILISGRFYKGIWTCEFIVGVPSGTLEGILEGRVLSSSFINFMLDSLVMGSHLLHFSYTNLYLSLSLFFFFFALTRHLFVLPPTSSCLSNNCPLTLCVSAQGSLFWSPVYHPITLPCHSVPLFLALISVWSYFDYLLVFCLLTYLLVSSKMQVQESTNFAQDAYSYNT